MIKLKDKKTLGMFIKEKRIEKNYSQKELAELLFPNIKHPIKNINILHKS